jgi:hypothetical protein
MDEDLKNSFIVNENPDEKKVEGYIKRLLPYCKTTKTGAIIFNIQELKSLEKVKIFLVARYLANFLESSISGQIQHDEFVTSLDLPKDQINARLKDIRDEKFADILDDGSYRVKAQEISRLLDKLDERYGKNKIK